MKKIVLGAAALVALVLVAALAVPALVDWSRYKTEITSRLERATGREVTISGDVGLRLLPSPAFRANGITIGTLPGAGGPPLATARSLDIRLRLLPLLGGKVAVDSLVLDKPAIHLARLPDGRANWEFTPQAKPEPQAPAQHPSAAGPEEDKGFSIGNVHLRDGSLTYQNTTLSAIDARIEAASAEGPFLAQGSLRLRGVPISFDGGLDRVAEQRGSPARLSVSVPGLDARAEFNGVLSRLSGGETLVGPLSVKLGDAARLLPALPAGTPLQAEGTLSASAKEVTWKDVAASLGDTRATGGVNVGLGGGTSIDIKATIASLDLDKWQLRKPAAQAAAPVPPAPSGPSQPQAPSEPAGFTLPQDLFATLDLAVETLAWRGQVVRQARLDAVLDQGELTLQNAAAQLPGGSVVSLAGTVATPGGKPAFDGQAEARSDNLRAVLDWLQVDTGSVPQDRLRAFEGSATLRATPAELHLRDLRLRLDGATAHGTVDARLSGRPAYGVSLAADTVNIDAYRGGKAKARPQAKEDDKPATAPTVSQSSSRRELAPFDAELRLKARRVVAFGRNAEEVSVDASLGADALVVREATGRLEGMPLRVAGKAAGQDGHYAIDGRGTVGGLELTAKGGMDADRYDVALRASHESFVQAVRLFAPAYRPAGSTGALAASAKVTGGPERIEISALDLKAGTARVTGQASVALGGKPSITAELASNAIDLDPFMPAERTGMLPGGGRLAPLPGQALAVIPAAAAPAGSPFSPEPLDLAALRDADARVTWRGEALSWQGWKLENVVAELALKDGIGTIDRLTGKLLGGDMSVTARLDSNAVPSLTGAATIAGANMAQVKLGAGDIRVTQGRLDADTRFATAGRSSQDMAARLQGNGKLNVTDGIITGFDLAAVNQRLNNIENVGSLLGLAQAGLGGGQTRFTRLSGTFAAENGVITSRDLKLDAQGGRATAETTIRLPPWTMQTAIAIALADAKAPPLVIRLDGPMGNPRKVIDINEIQQYLVARGLGRALKNKAPAGEDSPGAPAGKPSGPAVLRELFKGFGGR